MEKTTVYCYNKKYIEYIRRRMVMDNWESVLYGGVFLSNFIEGRFQKKYNLKFNEKMKDIRLI